MEQRRTRSGSGGTRNSGGWRKRNSSGGNGGGNTSGSPRRGGPSKKFGAGTNFRKRTNSSSGGFSSGGGRRGGRGPRKMPTFDPSQFINKNPVEVKEVVYEPKNTFKTFGLDTKISNIVEHMGLITPSPIQDKIIPHVMRGHDVIGLAETGTGKTAAFLLPLIHKTMHEDKGGKMRKTLILTPTR